MKLIAHDTRLSLILICVLAACYLLIYLDKPNSIDGEATLAVAASMVQHGTADIAVIGSAEGLLPPISRMGSFGPNGVLYAKKGIVPSVFMLPLVVISHIIPDMPVRATATLFNPIITTLTSLLLYGFARRLNYRPSIAFILALIYGCATMAFVYAQSLYGEPLAALLLTTAVFSAWQYRTTQQPRWLACAGLMLGLLLGINLSYGLMAPLVGLYSFGINPRRWPIRHLLAMLTPFMMIVGLIMLWNMIRFGNPLSSGYHFEEGEGFTFPFLIGLFGLTFSGYGGLFLYSPILWASLPGAWQMQRIRPRLTMLLIALTLTQLFTYASWWSWHGGIVWGPRFTIPITPLLALLLLPMIELSLRRPRIGIGFSLLAALSFAIQLMGALYNFVYYTIKLYDQYAEGISDGFFIGLSNEVVFNYRLSPILGQIGLIADGQASQVAAFKNADVLHLLIVVLLLILALIIWRKPHLPRYSLWGVTASVLLAGGVIAMRQQHVSKTANMLRDTLQPADTLVVESTSYSANLIDFKGPTDIITMNAPTAPDDPLASGLWQQARKNGGLLWLITWFPPASPENWPEADLWQNAAFVRQTAVDGDRALLFDLTDSPEATQASGATFGAITLTHYGIEQSADGIRITLDWQRNAPMAEDFAWFVHLIGPDGQIIMQQDRPPQGGYAPTSTWQAGETITDRLFFPLPQQEAPPNWQLRLGFVNAAGELLPVTTADGIPNDTGFILLMPAM